MSTTIKILPENLTNKIAAGEVVERPASVAKELVENALDAGAREVIVEIESGGRRLIRVSDNGCGMSREDALLALERHATSKISSDDDLFSISTLGFRGEALPSIASVSRLTISTRSLHMVEGTEIYSEGGRVKEVKGCGMAAGTVIAVRNLFFNTPARLKFMKSSETEGGHVGELLTRLAISRPDVRFIYNNDGKVVFRALDADLKERVATMLGRALAASLYPVRHEEGAGFRVTGLVASPECSRSSATHLYTYINGRFIRDKVVQHAVMQAYRNFLERGRYPVVAIFIEIPPSEVDVNVHPTKHEVRFREQGRVHDAIQSAVEAVLKGTPWLKRAPTSPHAGIPLAPVLPNVQPRHDATRSLFNPRDLGSPCVSDEKVAHVREILENYHPTHQPPLRHMIQDSPQGLAALHPQQTPGVTAGLAESLEAVSGSGYFSSLSVIGQFNASYILCQQGSDLVLIDQHAAHERVAFERLKREFAQKQVDSQGLLLPETLELSFRESATLKVHHLEFARLGFSVENFGGNTWLLKGVPQILSETDYLRTMRDILEEFANLSRSRSFTDVQEDLLARIACHSVVRGRHTLSTCEIGALFAQMDRTDFSSNCPHGRPVLKRITISEIEKMFKRT